MVRILFTSTVFCRAVKSYLVLLLKTIAQVPGSSPLGQHSFTLGAVFWSWYLEITWYILFCVLHFDIILPVCYI